MFKRIVLIASLVLTSQMVQAELKIGVVNIPLLMSNAPQAADAKKRLEREFAPKDRQLVSQQKDIKRLEERLGRDGLTMNEEEKRRLERDIISKRRDAQRAQQEFKEDFGARRNEELGKMQTRIIQAVKALASEGRYDLLLTEGVIHASPAVDVTSQVQAKLASMP